MIAYASHTGTRRNLDGLEGAGWRILVAPVHRRVKLRPGFRWCLDNGAWAARKDPASWSESDFLELVALKGRGADFVVVPDVVGDARATLAKAEHWLPRLQGRSGMTLIAVQNGMLEEDVRYWLGPSVGLFVGGDTAWKISTVGRWAQLARERGAWCHVGRVNSVKRIHLCALAGAHSFDGTSASRYAKTIPKLNHARLQSSWVFPEAIHAAHSSL